MKFTCKKEEIAMLKIVASTEDDNYCPFYNDETECDGCVINTLRYAGSEDGIVLSCTACAKTLLRLIKEKR